MAATGHTDYLHLPLWEKGNVTNWFELNSAFESIDSFALVAKNDIDNLSSILIKEIWTISIYKTTSYGDYIHLIYNVNKLTSSKINNFLSAYIINNEPLSYTAGPTTTTNCILGSMLISNVDGCPIHILVTGTKEIANYGRNYLQMKVLVLGTA